MAKKLESRTSLTEFAPLSPESKSRTFSIRNIFFRNKEKSTSSEIKTPEAQRERPEDAVISDDLYMSSDSPYSVEKRMALSGAERRGMSGILGKIMDNIVDKKKKGLQNYKDSDFKQYWMLDSNCKECYDCGDKFTTFRRRHHCRVCGQIFCWRCCNQEIPGDLIGYTDDLRVCSFCCKLVLSCVQSLDSSQQTEDDSQSFRESQQKKFRFDSQSESLPSPKQSITSPARRKSSVIGFREEDFAKAKPFKSALESLTCRERTQKIDGPIQDRAHLKQLMHQLLNSVQSVSLWKQEYKDHHTKVILGCDIVDWLVEHDATLSRSDAVNIGQAFIHAQLFECIMPQQKFIDGNVFYKPLEQPHIYNPDENSNEIQESMEPLWVKEIQPSNSYIFKDNNRDSSNTLSPITPRLSGSLSRLSSSSSMFYLDLDVKESKVSIFKSQHESETSTSSKPDAPATSGTNDSTTDPDQENVVFFNTKVLGGFVHDADGTAMTDDLDNSIMKSIISSRTWHHSHLREDNGEKSAFENLNATYKTHEATLLNQLLSNEGLSLSWSEIILPIIHHVVDSVRPDVKNDSDDMDIRQYVQFKKIPGGAKTECSIVSGVVFTKSVAHKKMRQRIQNPTVLLLTSAISYQRVENKLCSLDPIIMQEFEYLKNTIGKLTVFKPDILLVEKTVSRLAQEMLLDLGITVALNVKMSVMERVARCTQAAIVSTVDAHLGRPQLGTCKKYKVKTFSIGGKPKTLMFFEGCPENLGCTILLRGGSANELKKVKQVVQFMIYGAYNWNLERSFLMDEFAYLPSQVTEPMECDDTQEDEGISTEQLCIDSSVSHDIPSESNKVGDPGANLPKKSKSRVDELGRKLETESISDFSDPLHSYLQLENDVFLSDTCDFKVDDLPAANTFSKLLDDIILCSSLNVKPSLPFLETEAGKKCELRKFFPSEIYWSRHFDKENEAPVLHPIETQTDLDDENVSLKGLINSKNVEILPSHPLTNFRITDILNSSQEMQALLADFRARGGTIKYLCPHEKAAKEKEKKLTTIHQNKEHTRSEMNTNTGLCWEKKTDALDPYNHQTLAVLFSSYSCASDNAPNYCVNPWVVKMEFYGSNDITLGGFLDRYCFRSSYICPSATCITPMTEHVRKFVHGSGCVHILLHELSSGVPMSENNILMWSWCHICTKATPVVSMSQDTWSFSFAKYLELRFYADGYKRRGNNEVCQHSLHHDHYQYFAQNNLVAIFKYTPVLIWEVVFPAFIISVTDRAIPVTALVEQIKTIAMKGHGIHSDLLTTLFALREEYCETTSEDFIEDMIDMLKLETLPFREKIEGIQLQLTSPTLETLQIKSADNLEYNKDICNYMWKIEDQVTLLKFHIANVVQIWNSRIQEFILARKKEQKLQAKVTSQSSRVSEGSFNLQEESAAKPTSISPEDQLLNSLTVSAADSKGSESKRTSLTSKMCPKVKSENTKKYVESFCKEKCRRFSSPARSLSWGSINNLSKYDLGLPKFKRTKSEPDYLVCHSDEFNNVFFQREGSISSSDSFAYGVTPGICAALKVSEVEDYDSYVVCHKDSVDESGVSPVSRKHHERSKSETEAVMSHSSHGSKHTPEKQASMDGKTEKRSVKNLLNTLKPASTFTPLENPFSNLEHLLLPVPQKVPVIVHEGEPSSIIAYALATDDYEQKLQELKLNLNTMNISQKDSQTSSPLLKHRSIKLQSESTSRSDVHFSSDDTYDFSVDSTDKTHLKPTSKATSNLHLEVQFTDNSTKFYCRVYYAEQFRKLRSLIFAEGEERFIRSLSHCIQWVARGGKSGSLFCKTHDDRFILKQMPRLELQSFMDLAPAYFQYLNKSYLEQKPTLLAKIVGIFRIGFKNTTTNAATKMDLLVMENLFYNRNITKKYDLKGSIRNRLVNTNGDQEEDIVLLDENLLKITCDNPFYVRPHSKTVLTLAISNDTQFLVDQSVMDYSLLVGLEEEKGQLVVGIIDYIRTFTWDKKVEMLIKSSGILGGHGKLPTVVSPELYRMRFCEAMDSYFLWIPDRWTGLGKGVDG